MPRTKSAESSKRAAKPAGKKAAAPATPEPKRELVAKGITEAQKTAGALATSASLNAAAVMHPFQKNLIGADATTDALFDAVQSKVKLVQAGDLAPVEAMLMAQAMSLQTTYASLMRKAAAQEYLPQYQAHMTLALKAQAQSRATLEALIELKQPRHAPTFIKQANMANGPQQVNNGSTAGAQPIAPAEQSASAPTKLLDAIPSPAFEQMSKGVNDERLEQRAPRAAG